MKTRKIQLPTLGRDALVRADTVNDDDRTVEILWTTGATVRRRRFWEDDFDEELVVDESSIRLERLNGGAAPFLNTHDAWSLDAILGVIVEGSVRIEGGNGYATVKFSEREDVEPIFRDIKAGIIKSVSVGYRVHKYEIEKRDGAVELWRAVDWEPMEISAVSIPADPGAKVRKGDSHFTCEVATRRADNDADNGTANKGAIEMPKPNTPAASTGDQATDENRNSPAATPSQSAATVDNAAEISAAETAARAAERARLGVIDEVVARHNLDADFKKRMVEGDFDATQVRAEALEEIGKRARDEGATYVNFSGLAGEAAETKFVRAAESAIILRAGAAGIVKQHEGDKGVVDPAEFRGYRLVDLARTFLEFRGERVTLMSPEAIVKRSFELTRASSGLGAQNTGDFPVLLESAMHRMLAAAYGTTPDSWSRFCKVDSVNDFRPHYRYRPGSFGALDALTETGEFKQKNVNDGEKYSITATTKGNIVAVTRAMLINDDLGAFTDLLMQLGRAAKLTIEIDVYNLLKLNAGLGPNMTDGNPMFDASHANIATAGAISVAVFDSARVKMATQKDPSGNEVLDLRPAILVLPIGSGGDARVINDAQYDPDTADKLQKPNKVRGLFRDIVDTPRLSGTRFYAFADPNVAPSLVVAFLNGQTEPFLDSEEGWRTDGAEFKVRADYAVGAADHRAAVTGAGA